MILGAHIACLVVPPAIHLLERGWGQIFNPVGLRVAALAADVGCSIVNAPTSIAFAALDARVVFLDVRALNPLPALAQVYPRYMGGRGR